MPAIPIQQLAALGARSRVREIRREDDVFRQPLPVEQLSETWAVAYRRQLSPKEQSDHLILATRTHRAHSGSLWALADPSPALNPPGPACTCRAPDRASSCSRARRRSHWLHAQSCRPLRCRPALVNLSPPHQSRCMLASRILASASVADLSRRQRDRGENYVGSGVHALSARLDREWFRRPKRIP